jgi:hypothetical protein
MSKGEFEEISLVTKKELPLDASKIKMAIIHPECVESWFTEREMMVGVFLCAGIALSLIFGAAYVIISGDHNWMFIYASHFAVFLRNLVLKILYTIGIKYTGSLSHALIISVIAGIIVNIVMTGFALFIIYMVCICTKKRVSGFKED